MFQRQEGGGGQRGRDESFEEVQVEVLRGGGASDGSAEPTRDPCPAATRRSS